MMIKYNYNLPSNDNFYHHEVNLSQKILIRFLKLTKQEHYWAKLWYILKIFFRYIAAVTNTSGQSEIERATNVLLHSNDILEAFGNAKVGFQWLMIL